MTISEMKNVDIRTVDANELEDINNIKINTKLPVNERIKEFVRRIKNPYCYKCGDLIIKIKFEETDDKFEDILNKTITATDIKPKNL